MFPTKKHVLSKLDWGNFFQALFKYGLGNALQVKKDAFGLKKTEMFPAALVLIVTKNTRIFQIGFGKMFYKHFPNMIWILPFG